MKILTAAVALPVSVVTGTTSLFMLIGGVAGLSSILYDIGSF